MKPGRGLQWPRGQRLEKFAQRQKPTPTEPQYDTPQLHSNPNICLGTFLDHKRPSARSQESVSDKNWTCQLLLSSILCNLKTLDKKVLPI